MACHFKGIFAILNTEIDEEQQLTEILSTSEKTLVLHLLSQLSDLSSYMWLNFEIM